MRRLRFAPIIGCIGALLMVAASLMVVSVTAQTPTTGSSPTADVGSPVTGSASPMSTGVSGSAIAPTVSGTVEAPSVPVPPDLTPSVVTSSGPSGTQITTAVIGIVIGVVIVALGGWGLIWMIGSTGGAVSRR